MNSIAITGHRPQRLKGQEKNIKEWAKRQLKKINPDIVYCGMARGVDQIIGNAAKEMGIPLICCFPYPRNSFHPLEEHLMENNKIIFVSDRYSRRAYEKRDRFMIEHADIVLCVWDGKPWGGTYTTREYAIKLGKTVIDFEGLK